MKTALQSRTTGWLCRLIANPPSKEPPQACANKWREARRGFRKVYLLQMYRNYQISKRPKGQDNVVACLLAYTARRD